MKYTLLAAFLVYACGCPQTGVRWRNDSGLTDAQLDLIWARAQQMVATKPFDLNAGADRMNPKIAPDWKGPDQRALSVKPQNVTVVAVPPQPGQTYILEPGGTKVNGYTDGPDGCSPTVYFSRAFISPNDIAANDGSLGYEFQNIILARLGYNVSGR